jgi:hypothetical protein
MTDGEELGRLARGPRDDDLKLPRGAFIAWRQSGGLRFSTREVTVYHDGRVIWNRQGKLAEEGSRRITPAEVTELKTLIEHSGLGKFSNPIGRPSPDGYAYELVARFGRKSTAIEFFDGSLPAQLHALLQRLKMLMTTRPE